MGHEVTYSESEGNKLSLVKFPYPNFGLDNIDQATVKDKSVSHSHNGIVSAFARVNYTFDERYLSLPRFVVTVPPSLPKVTNGVSSLLFPVHGVFQKKISGRKMPFQIQSII